MCHFQLFVVFGFLKYCCCAYFVVLAVSVLSVLCLLPGNRRRDAWLRVGSVFYGIPWLIFTIVSNFWSRCVARRRFAGVMLYGVPKLLFTLFGILCWRRVGSRRIRSVYVHHPDVRSAIACLKSDGGLATIDVVVGLPSSFLMVSQSCSLHSETCESWGQ
jgi:hypothetical protein